MHPGRVHPGRQLRGALSDGPADLGAFVAAHTRPTRLPFLPSIVLHLGDQVVPLWSALETLLHAAAPTEPPFWAFPWVGGQALARFVLEQPAWVAGKRVLDFAAGCGVVAIAAARAGAARVEAAEIDLCAGAAIALNAAANAVAIEVLLEDVVGRDAGWDVVFAGDVCYQRGPSSHITAWLRELARTRPVFLADPGRAFLPDRGLSAVARWDIPAHADAEGVDARDTVVYRVVAD